MNLVPKNKEIHNMRIEFHRTGLERKALVTAIGEILEIKPKYKGMPSAAYEIGTFTVNQGRCFGI